MVLFTLIVLLMFCLWAISHKEINTDMFYVNVIGLIMIGDIIGIAIVIIKMFM